MFQKRTHVEIPIHVLGLLFIVLFIVTLTLLAWYTNQKIITLGKHAEHKSYNLAQQELNTTLKKLIATTAEVAVRFSEWDETLQQLQNPTYYKYWQINRVPKVSFIPDYFDAIELYDKSGTALSKSTEINMPLTVNSKSLEPYVVMDVDHPHLYYQSIIYSNGDANPAGFLVVKIDVTEVLNKQTFRYVDFDKLHYDLTVSYRVTIDEFFDLYKITAKINPEFLLLEDLFIVTLLNISVVSLVLFMMFLVLVINYLGIPLRTLSQQIDMLGKGENILIEKKFDNVICIAEVEKVHNSLNDYHQQLYVSEKELRESEYRNRTVLEAVPDAIITLNKKLMILSMNPAAEALFGYHSIQLKGTNIECLFAKDSIDKFHHALASSYFDRYDSHEALKKQFIGQHKDGFSFQIECSLTEILLSGENSYLFIAKDITEQKLYESQLTHLANFDSLTGLSNRGLFNDRLEHAITQAKRNNERLGLLFIDLDRFKIINDTHGHQIGDLLLTTVAKRINRCVREGDTVARLSGDEFTIIIEGVEHEEDSAVIAKNILQVLRKPFILNNIELYISASIGITTYPEDDKDINRLIKNADTAMYRAKELGGDKYQFFTIDLNLRAEQRLSLENKLRNALDKGLFVLHYQPKINIKNKNIAGVEALMRFNDPLLGNVMPDKFIPILEETGMIYRTGEWVIRTACTHYMQWSGSGIQNIGLSVNISAHQFKEEKLVDMIFDILNETGMNPTNFEIEITESLLVENIEETANSLMCLHDRGIKISIDDFGTGYSSLAYLKKFPIDILKIDKSFVKDITNDHNSPIIVETIIAMAKSLKLDIIAEGVETVQQLEFLKQRDCDVIQGYIFSKPLSSDELMDYIDSEAWLIVSDN